jgi:5-formyltetrahydrofolate cyclo-ligase
VLVPGLGFDDRGHRVGYGKGYYDRFLARADAGVTAGVTYEQCLVPRMPDQPHDHPVGWVVTPDRRIRAQTEHVQ